MPEFNLPQRLYRSAINNVCPAAIVDELSTTEVDDPGLRFYCISRLAVLGDFFLIPELNILYQNLIVSIYFERWEIALSIYLTIEQTRHLTERNEVFERISDLFFSYYTSGLLPIADSRTRIIIDAVR